MKVREIEDTSRGGAGERSGLRPGHPIDNEVILSALQWSVCQ